MTWIFLVLAIVFLIAAGDLYVLWQRSQAAEKASAEQAKLYQRQVAASESAAASSRQEAEVATAARDSERQRADAAEERAANLDAKLAVAGSPAAENEDLAGAPPAAYLDALWDMALLEQQRAWRLTMAVPEGEDVGGPHGLADMLNAEIARLREESGIPGRLQVSGDTKLSPGSSLIALRAIEGLIAAFNRYCDSYDLHLDLGESELKATLLCDKFNGPDSAADDAGALLRAIASTGATMDIDKAGNSLRSTLHLPHK